MSLWLMLTALLAAPVDGSVLPTHIAAVTVFRNHALVVRTATTTVGAARDVHRILLGGLPPNLVESSVQARCRGGGGASVVGFTLRPQAAPPAPGPAPEKVEQAMRLQERAQSLEDESNGRHVAIARARDRQSALAQLRSSYFTRVHKGEGEMDLGAWLEELAKLSAELETLDAKILAHEVARRRRGAQVNELRAEAQRLLATPAPAPAAQLAELDVLARRRGPVTCDVRYLIGGAGFSSRYDARLEKDTISFSHYGLVTNRTGEPWHSVRLSLTTANPTRVIALPTLQPHALTLSPPHHARPGLDARGHWKPHAGAPARPEAQEDRTSLSAVPPPDMTATHGELFATYSAASRVSVPATGAAREVHLTTRRLAPKLEYLSIPRVAPGAYLTARAEHLEDTPVLAGPVRLFVGDDYVGESRIPHVSPGGELSFSFGRDERVRVVRTRRTRDVRAADDAMREVADWYRIRIHNETGRRIAVTVLETLPLSHDPAVSVSLDPESTPRAKSEPADTAETLRWRLNLDLGRDATIDYGTRVRHPAGRHVIGL